MTKSALDLRDAVTTMILGLISRERPKPRVCEVYSFDRFTRYAEVLLPGETVPGLQARFPTHMQPTASKMDDGVGNATGNLVLVEGTSNNYRITQIIEGNAYSQASPFRAYDLLTGGGIVTWDDRYLKWTTDLSTFIGVDQVISTNMFVISMPGVGALVNCHGINGFTTVAVTVDGIDMRPDGTMNHTALYWEPDLTLTTGDVGTFHVVGGVVPFYIPPHWIMIAVMNQVADYLYMNTGIKYPLPVSPQPVTVYSTVDEGPGATSTPYVAGSNPCGLVFTAPPSGAVYVTVTSRFKENVVQNVAFVSYSIRAGNTIGSGTSFFAAADDFALAAGASVSTLGPDVEGGSRRKLHTGLVPGSLYNVQVEFHSVTEGGGVGGGTITVHARELLVEPVFI